MKIYSVYDKVFSLYGQVLGGYDTNNLQEEMKKIPLPETGTSYKAGINELERLDIFKELASRAYGGMPIQLGMCWGRNTKLNCLEYHKDNELNIGSSDFILLLAKKEQLSDGVLKTDLVKAFRVPAGVLIEVYATTLHFAPCHVNEQDGFRVAVVLPKGTNLEKPSINPQNAEDKMLWACNKWLIAHEDSKQAKLGAYIGLIGKNIDIEDSL